METEFKSLQDCRPLLNLAGADLFQRNAFRVTGLPVDADARDVARLTEHLRLLGETGRNPTLPSRFMPLRPPPSTAETRAALDILKAPENRLTHEMFWFWPEVFGNSQADAAFQAWAAGDGEAALRIWTLKDLDPKLGGPARHNLAVFWLLTAIEREREMIGQEVDPGQWAAIEECWSMAFKRWKTLAADDVFWDGIFVRIRQVGNPRLSSDFGRRLRIGLIEALGKTHVELALRHLEEGRPGPANFHAALMRLAISYPSRMALLLEPALEPARLRLRDQAREVRRAAESDPQNAAFGAGELLAKAGPLLDIIDFLNCGTVDHRRSVCLDETALALETCADALQRLSPQDPQIPGLLKQARQIAVDGNLVSRIDGKLAGIESIGLFRPIHAEIQDIMASSEPSLSRMELLRERTLPALAAIEATQPASPASAQARETAALALRDIARNASREPQGWETSEAAIDLALSLTRDRNLASQLWADRQGAEQLRAADLEAARSQERRRAAQGLLAQFRQTGADGATPKVILERIEKTVLPALTTVAPEAANAANAAKDCAAAALRFLSITAWNDYGDSATARLAIERALPLARTPDLARRIASERDVAVELHLGQISRNLLLETRSGRIEISGEGVRVKTLFLPVEDILGIRFGLRRPSSAGRWSSYAIEVKSVGAGPVLIDCHRSLRSSAKNQADFDALAEALATHIAPRIIGRIAGAACTPEGYAFFTGEAFDFTGPPASGRAETPAGTLFGDGLRLLLKTGEIWAPLEQLKTVVKDGALIFEAIPGLSWPLGDVWNAVYFSEILVAAQRRKRGGGWLAALSKTS